MVRFAAGVFLAARLRGAEAGLAVTSLSSLFSGTFTDDLAAALGLPVALGFARALDLGAGWAAAT